MKRVINEFYRHTLVFPFHTYELSRAEQIVDLIRAESRVKEYLKPHRHLIAGVDQEKLPLILKGHDLIEYHCGRITPEWYLVQNPQNEWRMVRKTGTLKDLDVLQQVFKQLQWWDFEMMGLLTGAVECELIEWNTVVNDCFVETSIT